MMTEEFQDQVNCIIATMANYIAVVSSEPEIVFKYLNSNGSFAEFNNWDKVSRQLSKLEKLELNYLFTYYWFFLRFKLPLFIASLH